MPEKKTSSRTKKRTASRNGETAVPDPALQAQPQADGVVRAETKVKTAASRGRKAPASAAAEELHIEPRTALADPPGHGYTGDDLAEEIRRRAYELYEQRGRQHGYDIQDWHQAEHEIRGRRKRA